MLKIARMGQFRDAQKYDPEDSGVLIRQVLAHGQSIISLDSHSQGGLISCSKDCQVRIWSHYLDLWGVIDQTTFGGDPLWSFPDRDAKKRERRDAQAMQSMADMVRQENEQAYAVVLAEVTQTQKHEEFSGQRVYERMLALYTEKRDRQRHERDSKVERLAEEKTEWYRLLALQKGEPMQFHIEKLVFDKDLEKLKKVNAHIDR